MKVHIRALSTLIVAVFLASASCTSTNQPNPLPLTTSAPEPTGPSSLAPDEVTSTPPCFSPDELLPFAFSPDGSQLAVRRSQGVQFFDLLTGQEAASIEAPRNILSVALSPDGETLAWTLDDNNIQLVQIADATIRSTLVAHPDPVFDLRFSPTGSELFSASHDGTVRVWDTATGTLLPPFEVGLEVLGIGVSPDGALLGVVPGYGPVQLWDIDDRKLVAELSGTGGYDTSDVTFSVDGKRLVADLATGIFLWDLSTQREIWSGIANSMAVAFSPDGASLAFTDIDQGNKVFLGPADGQGNFTVIDQMQGPVWELFFSQDSSLLAATDGIEIRVWDLMEGKRILTGKTNCSQE